MQTIHNALTQARRRDRTAKAAQIAAALRTEHLGQPPVVAAAYAVTVRAQTAIISVLNTQIAAMEEQVEANFPGTRTLRSTAANPASARSVVVGAGARVLAESGDDKTRYANGRTRRNYAGTSPITRQSGKKKTVLTCHVHNDRLPDALGRQAFSALRASPGARAYYDRIRARGTSHQATLRQLGNRLVGILHGRLKTGTNYNETKAWTPLQQNQQLAA